MAPALQLQESLFLGPLVKEGTFEQERADTKSRRGEQDGPAEKNGIFSSCSRTNSMALS
jgi:hypothetical protein